MNGASASPNTVAGQFRSAEQQAETTRLGAYLGLSSVVFFFGALVCIYMVFRLWYPEAFAAGSGALSWRSGVLGTLIMITGSFTMALAVHHIRAGDVKKLNFHLLVTFVMALIFLMLKYREVTQQMALGQFWAGKFATGRFTDPHVPLFFATNLTLTLMHATLVVVAMIFLARALINTGKGSYSSENYASVESVGLLWQVAGIISLLLLPLIYFIAPIGLG